MSEFDCSLSCEVRVEFSTVASGQHHTVSYFQVMEGRSVWAEFDTICGVGSWNISPKDKRELRYECSGDTQYVSKAELPPQPFFFFILTEYP